MIDTQKLMSACRKAPEKAYEFFKALTVYENAYNRACHMDMDSTDSLVFSANKAIGRLRGLEKEAGIATVGYLSPEDVILALDELLYRKPSR